MSDKQRATSILEFLTTKNPDVVHLQPKSKTNTHDTRYYFPKQLKKWDNFKFEIFKEIEDGKLFQAARKEGMKLPHYPTISQRNDATVKNEANTRKLIEKWSETMVTAALDCIQDDFNPAVWMLGQNKQHIEFTQPVEEGIKRIMPPRQSAVRGRSKNKTSRRKLYPDSGAVSAGPSPCATGREGETQFNERFPKEYKVGTKWFSDEFFTKGMVDEHGNWTPGSRGTNYAMPIGQAYSYCLNRLCRYGCILTCYEAFIFGVTPQDKATKDETLEKGLMKSGLMEYVSIPWSNHCEGSLDEHASWTVNLALWFMHILIGKRYEVSWEYRDLKDEELATRVTVESGKEIQDDATPNEENGELDEDQKSVSSNHTDDTVAFILSPGARKRKTGENEVQGSGVDMEPADEFVHSFTKPRSFPTMLAAGDDNQKPLPAQASNSQSSTILLYPGARIYPEDLEHRNEASSPCPADSEVAKIRLDLNTCLSGEYYLQENFKVTDLSACDNGSKPTLTFYPRRHCRGKSYLAQESNPDACLWSSNEVPVPSYYWSFILHCGEAPSKDNMKHRTATPPAITQQIDGGVTGEMQFYDSSQGKPRQILAAATWKHGKDICSWPTGSQQFTHVKIIEPSICPNGARARLARLQETYDGDPAYDCNGGKITFEDGLIDIDDDDIGKYIPVTDMELKGGGRANAKGVFFYCDEFEEFDWTKDYSKHDTKTTKALVSHNACRRLNSHEKSRPTTFMDVAVDSCVDMPELQQLYIRKDPTCPKGEHLVLATWRGSGCTGLPDEVQDVRAMYGEICKDFSNAGDSSYMLRCGKDNMKESDGRAVYSTDSCLGRNPWSTTPQDVGLAPTIKRIKPDNCITFLKPETDWMIHQSAKCPDGEDAKLAFWSGEPSCHGKPTSIREMNRNEYVMLSLKSFVLALAAASGVSAHYNFDRLYINGQQTGEYEFMRRTTNGNGPLLDVTTKDIVCNQGGNNADIRAATKTATVKAGDTLGFNVRDILEHPGPANVYLSKAPSGVTAQNYQGDGDWFKIYSLGVKQFRPNKGVLWAVMPNSQNGIKNFTFTLPKDTPPGDYLLRAEHIALHAAGTPNGAQFYVGCAQLTITGSGTGKPAPTVKFPGAYRADEPGILFPLYWPPVRNYTTPGPATWPNKCEDHTANLIGQASDGDCTAILPLSDKVAGYAYEVQSSEHDQKLVRYETNADKFEFRWIDFTGAPAEKSARVQCNTVVYAGDAAALKAGQFDRTLWELQMGLRLPDKWRRSSPPLDKS
ncbi:putative endo-beta-1,4-glucanase D [Paramyrothecium foliicola]|nr:putative endo-beta-1,4-glucanase D [Paramyrothecium foliicola]